MELIKTKKQFTELLKSQFNPKDSGEDKDYKYAIYLRKSSESEDKQERSLRDQLADCQDLILREGLRVVRIFEESMSAKEPDIRPKYREMIGDLQSGKYDGIIAWHPNRLARNMKDGGEIIDLLDMNIIKDLKFVSYTYSNDTSGKMLLGMTFVISKQYSDHLSDSVSRGNRRSIEEGRYINKAKHGYKKDRNSFLRPDGKHFTLVVDAFNMRLEGKTLDEIADHLNKNGYERQNALTGRVYSQKADKEKVRRFLRDPIYTGVVVYGNTVVDLTEIYDFVPAVSVEDFMKINELDKKSDIFKLAKSYRKGDTVKSDLLRNKVICAGCGEARNTGITAKKLKSGTKNYFYYRCETDGCPMENKSTRAKVILDFAIKYLEKKPFSHVDAYTHYKEEMRRLTKEQAQLTEQAIRLKKSELTKTEERFANIKSAMVIEKDEEMKKYQKEEFRTAGDRVVQINEEIEKLNKQMKAIKGAPLSYENFLELFDNMALLVASSTKMSELDYLLGKVFSNFTINKKNVEEYTLNEPFASLERLETSNVSYGAR
jgi:site-specific DNA recombinase